VVNPSPVANFHNYEINPETGSDTVQFADNSIFADSWAWNFDDPSSGVENTSAEQSPMHIFESNGAYNVTLVVTNIYGCSDSISLPSKVNVGIEELTIDMQSTVYPNPASEWIELAVFSSSNKNIMAKMVDVSGMTVISTELNLFSGVNKRRFDIAQLDAGTYVLTIVNVDGEQSYPFVVAR
jgi:PKD repeat protein